MGRIRVNKRIRNRKQRMVRDSRPEDTVPIVIIRPKCLNVESINNLIKKATVRVNEDDDLEMNYPAFQKLIMTPDVLLINYNNNDVQANKQIITSEKKFPNAIRKAAHEYLIKTIGLYHALLRCEKMNCYVVSGGNLVSTIKKTVNTKRTNLKHSNAYKELVRIIGFCEALWGPEYYHKIIIVNEEEEMTQ